MIEIVAQASNDEREAFDFTKDLPPLRGLKAKKRSTVVTFLIVNYNYRIIAFLLKRRLTVRIANII